MLFSIIMPVFNAEELIEISIKSITSQDKELYELIIVDNCSGDNTLEIVKKHIELYPANIKILSEKDEGIFDAMNKGIRMSVGDYLYFIGAGDILTPNTLFFVSQNISEYPDIIYGDILLSTEKTTVGKEYTKADILSGFSCHQQFFYNKKIFAYFGLYNIEYRVFADLYMNTLCWADQKIMKKYINRTVAEYRGGGYSVASADEKYVTDIRNVIINRYGYEDYMKYYSLTGNEFFAVLRSIKNMRFILISRKQQAVALSNCVLELNQKYGNNACIDKKLDPDEISGCLCDVSQNIYYFIVGGSSITDELLIKISLMKIGINENKILIGRPMVAPPSIINFIEKNSNRDIIIFGTGKAASRLTSYISNHENNYDILCYFDNNPNKSGSKFLKKTVFLPNLNKITNNTTILVSSMYRQEITNQLLEMGVDENIIV